MISKLKTEITSTSGTSLAGKDWSHMETVLTKKLVF